MVGTLKVPSEFALETEKLSAELRQFPQFLDFLFFPGNISHCTIYMTSIPRETEEL